MMMVRMMMMTLRMTLRMTMIRMLMVMLASKIASTPLKHRLNPPKIDPSWDQVGPKLANLKVKLPLI